MIETLVQSYKPQPICAKQVSNQLVQVLNQYLFTNKSTLDRVLPPYGTSTDPLAAWYCSKQILKLFAQYTVLLKQATPVRSSRRSLLFLQGSVQL